MMSHDVNSEYEFIREMIPHHQEAVDSSLETMNRTARTELAAFAEEIVKVQQAEIIRMREWLSQWYPGQSDKADYMPMMRSVSGLSVDRADRAFLEDMIAHHRMAVMMAESLLSGNLTKRPELTAFAQAIITAQNDEIEQMEEWLKTWF